ncbi:hypothetical protein ACFFR3_23785, partial [Nonomuraea salmonea]
QIHSTTLRHHGHELSNRPLRPIDDSKDAVDVCYKPKSQACKQYRKRQAEVDAKIAQAEVDRQLKALMNAVLAIGKIIADELGITDGIKCFTSGDVAACGSTAINVLSSLAGGMVGKLAVKYGLPWKWKRRTKLARRWCKRRATQSTHSRTG